MPIHAHAAARWRARAKPCERNFRTAQERSRHRSRVGSPQHFPTTNLRDVDPGAGRTSMPTHRAVLRRSSGAIATAHSTRPKSPRTGRSSLLHRRRSGCGSAASASRLCRPEAALRSPLVGSGKRPGRSRMGKPAETAAGCCYRSGVRRKAATASAGRVALPAQNAIGASARADIRRARKAGVLGAIVSLTLGTTGAVVRYRSGGSSTSPGGLVARGHLVRVMRRSLDREMSDRETCRPKRLSGG